MSRHSRPDEGANHDGGMDVPRSDVGETVGASILSPLSNKTIIKLSGIKCNSGRASQFLGKISCLHKVCIPICRCHPAYSHWGSSS